MREKDLIRFRRATAAAAVLAPRGELNIVAFCVRPFTSYAVMLKKKIHVSCEFDQCTVDTHLCKLHNRPNCTDFIFPHPPEDNKK